MTERQQPELPRETPTAPVVYSNLAASDFPFTVQAHDEATNELLWQLVVEHPGPIHVPGFAPRKVKVTVIANDESATTLWSDQHEHVHPAPPA